MALQCIKSIIIPYLKSTAESEAKHWQVLNCQETNPWFGIYKYWGKCFWHLCHHSILLKISYTNRKVTTLLQAFGFSLLSHFAERKHKLGEARSEMSYSSMKSLQHFCQNGLWKFSKRSWAEGRDNKGRSFPALWPYLQSCPIVLQMRHKSKRKYTLAHNFFVVV